MDSWANISHAGISPLVWAEAREEERCLLAFLVRLMQELHQFFDTLFGITGLAPALPKSSGLHFPRYDLRPD